MFFYAQTFIRAVILKIILGYDRIQIKIKRTEKEMKVFEFFNEISAIPRGSGNTDAVSDYCVKFAQERGLEVIRDSLGNVIIKKAASAGYERSEAVILQGHLDMVCIAEEGLNVDFEKEPVRLFTDGDWIRARGTTLGADDGIAVAMILAILDSDDTPHPPIEAVFTVDEEVGLTGAANLDVSRLSGSRMINIDSEEEGIITVSCAGGIRAEAHIDGLRETFDGEFIKITAGGMKGGHSGMEIDKGRANADRVLATAISEIEKRTDTRLASFNGGLRDNAIPSVAETVIAVGDLSAVSDTLNTVSDRLGKEYGENIRFKIDSAAHEPVFDNRSTENIISAVLESPDGVQVMSADIEGLVETSLNLGIVKTTGDTVELVFMIRSSVETGKRELMDKLMSVIKKYGGEVALSGDYTAWEYRKYSPLRDIAVEAYKTVYGAEPQVAAIHAGLECGIFAGKIADFDAVSIGPDIIGAHTPDEKLGISSTKRVYEYVLEILKRLK